MKGNLKKFATLALASGISLTTAFAFAGCELFMSEEEKRQEEVFENAVEEVTERLTAVQEMNNFTYTRYLNNRLVYYFKFDGDLVEYLYLGDLKYCYTENDILYQMSQDDDGYWKTEIMDDPYFIEIFRTFSTTLLETINWSSYNEEENVLSGTQDGYSIQMSVNNGEIYYKAPGGLCVFSDIGTTTVTLPENVIDDTTEDEISTTKLAETDKVL